MSTASVDTIAKLLDMTPRRVQQLANEGIIPKPKQRGQYEIVPCVVGFIRHQRGMMNGDAGDLATEKSGLTRAQRIKTELEIGIIQKQLISATEAEEDWSALIGAFRSKLLTMSSRIAPIIANKSEKEAEAILTEALLEALTELSEWEPADEPVEDNTTPGSTEGRTSTPGEN